MADMDDYEDEDGDDDMLDDLMDEDAVGKDEL